MPAPLNASLPPGFLLTNNYTVRVTAQDPTSGGVVSSVIVSNASIAVDPQTSADMPVFTAPTPQLVPAQLA